MYNLNYATTDMGYNGQEKIYLGACGRKMLNITGLVEQQAAITVADVIRYEMALFQFLVYVY
jgi:hypothetical protein